MCVPQVVIETNTRNKKKMITTVSGLELFNLKLADASKLFGKKFACGCSVTKNAAGVEQIDMQVGCEGLLSLSLSLPGIRWINALSVSVSLSLPLSQKHRNIYSSKFRFKTATMAMGQWANACPAHSKVRPSCMPSGFSACSGSASGISPFTVIVHPAGGVATYAYLSVCLSPNKYIKQIYIY